MEIEKLDGLSEVELSSAADALAGGKSMEGLPSVDLVKLMTIGQYVADRGLAELERRGELEFHEGAPVIPYASEHMVETILTRPE